MDYDETNKFYYKVIDASTYLSKVLFVIPKIISITRTSLDAIAVPYGETTENDTNFKIGAFCTNGVSQAIIHCYVFGQG